MKIKSAFQIAVVMVTVLSFAQSSKCFAQGSLTPPGAPTPAMKTLSQVEPRTPISSAPFTITQPGAYYLTTNVMVSSGNGITIATNGVALDLDGFTIFSSAALANGIGISINSGLRNITIANGFIQSGVTNNGSGVYSGGGFSYGIYYTTIPPGNVLISHVSVSGSQYYGIFLGIGDSTVVESCTVRTVGSYGIISSVVKQSSATDCGGIAIYGAQICDCQGRSSTSSDGIYGSVAQNCYGSSAGGSGVYATTVQNCLGTTGGTGSGISGTTIQNSYGSSINGYGIVCYNADNCFGTCNGSGYGISADAAQNCYGYCSGSGGGVSVSSIANGCIGYSYSGTGLSAFIANVCLGETGTGTGLSVTYNVNSH
ncbi:MAG TPA: hypothetical protein VMH87_04940 [Pseudomonadales bacterium]|nr:hypothetical protein [Pseudomonadales bacterium]